MTDEPSARDLGDRVADPGEVGHLVPAVPEPPRGLGPALDEVPGDRRPGEPVPVVPGPTEVRGGRAEGQRGVGDPARHDDPRPVAQPSRDRPGAEVDVGADQPRPTRRRSAAPSPCGRMSGRRRPSPGSSRARRPLRRPRSARPPCPARPASAHTVSAQATGFRPPALVTTFSPACSLEDRREPRQQFGEVVDVPRRRVLRPEVAEDRQRQFGEVFEREHVEPAVAARQNGRVEVIAPEPGPVADPDRRRG